MVNWTAGGGATKARCAFFSPNDTACSLYEALCSLLARGKERERARESESERASERGRLAVGAAQDARILMEWSIGPRGGGDKSEVRLLFSQIHRMLAIRSSLLSASKRKRARESERERERASERERATRSWSCSRRADFDGMVILNV
jgi:hypothetical protein